jgi:predicted Kef-type K+ transport protein
VLSRRGLSKRSSRVSTELLLTLSALLLGSGLGLLLRRPTWTRLVLGLVLGVAALLLLIAWARRPRPTTARPRAVLGSVWLAVLFVALTLVRIALPAVDGSGCFTPEASVVNAVKTAADGATSPLTNFRAVHDTNTRSVLYVAAVTDGTAAMWVVDRNMSNQVRPLDEPTRKITPSVPQAPPEDRDAPEANRARSCASG